MEEVESCPFEEDHPDYAQSRSVLEEYFVREDANETDDNAASDMDDENEDPASDDEHHDVDELADTIVMQNVQPDNFHTDTDEEESASREIDTVAKFVEDSCGCEKYNRGPCSAAFTELELQELRAASRELDYYDAEHVNKLDIAILVQLRAFSSESTFTQRSKKKATVRVQKRSRFLVKGIEVCMKTFFFIHTIKKDRYKRLVKVYKGEGTLVKRHGNTNRKPHHALADSARKDVVKFILNYANQHAVFLPGRWSTQRNMAAKLLPASCTRSEMYALYKQGCEDLQKKSVGLTSFCRIWKTELPDVIIQKPKTDMCKFCQQNFTSHAKMTLSPMTTIKKRELIEKLQKHLDLAEEERCYYRDQVKISKDTYRAYTNDPANEIKPSIPCSYANMCHFTFDMAQLVMLPQNPMQAGPLYFLAGFKVCIFGVMNDTLQKQWNYLIPESASVEKGSSYIISMLDHALKNYGLGEETLFLHADNCCWQNKNNALMGYLNYLILEGRYKTVILSFMPVGHTKCSCDWCFGLFKQKFRKAEASTLQELAEVVEKSASVNEVVIVAGERGKLNIPFSKWQEYFFDHLKWAKIPAITSYYHFEFDITHPGTVLCKKTLADVGIRSTIGLFVDCDYLSITDPKFQETSTGIPPERQEYLYKNIREYCSSEATGDVLCPKPDAALLTKKRGRPPKEVTDAPKKKRGRPSKKVTEVVKKKRGRPPKVVTEAPKTKRGRPSKKPAVPDPSSSDSRDTDSSSDASFLEFLTPKPKCSRGSPKKV